MNEPQESLVEPTAPFIPIWDGFCADDGSGKNVYYVSRKDRTKARAIPEGYTPEYFINGDRRYYFRGKCLTCTRRSVSPVFLTANGGRIGFSFNLCDDCLRTRTPGITSIRGNGDAVYAANENMAKNFYADLEMACFATDRDLKLLERSIESKFYILAHSKYRRNEGRANIVKLKALDYDIKEGVLLSWGFDESLFDEYYGTVDKNRLPSGRGVKFFSDGSVYIGDWLGGEFHTEEKAIFSRPDGSQYEGSFVMGLKHGRGTQIYPDMSTYEGEWAKGYEHGHGKRKYADGSIFEGRYRFGRRDGPGIFISADGVAEKGNFRDNTAYIEKMPPLIVEKMEKVPNPSDDGLITIPRSLFSLALETLSSVMSKQRFIVKAEKMTRKLCPYLKSVVAREFLKRYVAEAKGTPEFLRIGPSYAFNTLEAVDLKGVKMTTLDTDSLCYFQAANKNLKVLALVSNKLQTESIDYISKQLQMKSWIQLETIDLSFNIFDMKAIQNLIVGINHTPTLKNLRLSGCGIKASGAFILSNMLATNRFLESLDVSFNAVEAIGAESLAKALYTNEVLKELNVRSNNIGIVGGQAFAKAMKHNMSICMLCLADNKVGTDAICEIAGRLRGKLTQVARSVCSDELDMPTTYKEGRFDPWDPIKRATRKIGNGDCDTVGGNSSDREMKIE